MANTSDTKGDRVLQIYLRLLQGEVLNKGVLAREFHVSPRTILRDISTLRCVLAEQHMQQDILCETEPHGYRLQDTSANTLTNSEILAVCKILLESRSMRKSEMLPILDKLVACCVPRQNRKDVDSLIANERYHYIEPHHGKKLLGGLWEIGQAIKQHRVMEIQYERLKAPNLVVRKIEPVGIMFSEYYFYLTAFLRNVDKQAQFENPNDLFPTIYRLDRIRSFTVLDEKFRVPYKDRFEEGEFRKRIQFMYGGKLQMVRFRYTGMSIEPVLDRLPTARAELQPDGSWIVTAEVFGKGIDIWLRSQGDSIEQLEISSI